MGDERTDCKKDDDDVVMSVLSSMPCCDVTTSDGIGEFDAVELMETCEARLLRCLGMCGTWSGCNVDPDIIVVVVAVDATAAASVERASFFDGEEKNSNIFISSSSFCNETMDGAEQRKW